MYSYIKCNELIIDCEVKKKLGALYEKYMRHEFDLLGSGYVKINYELQAKGVCGKRYCNPYMPEYGKKLEKRLKREKKCSDTYEPINWLVDYKSGFFFHPRKYDTEKNCREVVGKKQGVDIKCPWELGRCYHLVRLAVYAVGKESCREKIVIEFKDEVMDFITSNPVGRTVQWSGVMDTSIRTVNMLIAHDILRQMDDKGYLDDQFEKIFEKLITDSLGFVMSGLEYSGKTRAGGNHYLSNIVGIIFAAAYLPSDKYTDACCVFGVQELISQVERQFYPEGSHYEGSTSYHRLSAEFVIYATALIYGVRSGIRREIFKGYEQTALNGYNLKTCSAQKYNADTKEFFPQIYIDKIYNMGIFTETILKQNNEIVQIGENDNGRLVMLTPMGKAMRENVLDHRTLLAEIGSLFQSTRWNELLLEQSLIQSLANGVKVSGNAYQIPAFFVGQPCQKQDYPFKKETILYREEPGGKLNEDIEISCFDGFGMIVLRGKRVFVSMVIDTATSGRFYGHTHNDKLSIEVMVDEKYITRDPGSYIYTASPELMEKFCSVKAHNTIHVRGCEQNLLLGMWRMKRRVQAEPVYGNENGIAGKASYGEVHHLREVIVTDQEIIVRDYANCPFTVGFKNKIYSPQYGILEKTKEA